MEQLSVEGISRLSRLRTLQNMMGKGGGGPAKAPQSMEFAGSQASG